MNLLQWVKLALTTPKPQYNPEEDHVVRALRQQAAKTRRQGAVLRRARIQGRPASFEEMFGIEVPRRERDNG